MSLWTMIFLIVVVGCVTNVLTERYKALGRVRDGDTNGTGAKSSHEVEAQKREVLELRERIKVLERIATSDRESKQIASEIESLRDK